MNAVPVIVLEFNELTPSLIDRFIAQGHLPNFKRLREESRVFTTMAEERPPNLEPWIQWVTVHSGVPFSQHGVFHLNEGHKFDTKRIWEIVAEAGHPVWVCGSMNVREADGIPGGVLPDPWCTKVKPTPSVLETYFRFVQQNVLEHTNDRVPLSRSDYAQFLTFMVRHGLSVSTINAIGRQLLSERGADTKWKRVVLLDLLQFDVFAHYYKRLSPRFSTFFLNSTAHYQHAYWDSMDPESFRDAPDAQRAKYRDAIRFGYEKMDALIGKFLKLAEGSRATLVLCTALSQQPSLDYPSKDNAVFFRPKSFEEFGKAVGIASPFKVEPVMSEQFYLEFRTAEDAARAAETLRTVKNGESQVLAVRLEGTRVFTGCRIHEAVPADLTISMNGATDSFFRWFYQMDTGKTGVHHPDGILWIRAAGEKPHKSADRVPLTRVAPTLLRLCGVDAPAGMDASLS